MNENQPNTQENTSTAKTVGKGLKTYLTDWRNLLGHALLGIFFLVIAIWAPIDLWVKLIIIAVLITFNTIRMRRKHKKQPANPPTD